MTAETILTAEQKDEFVTDIIEYGTDFVAPLYATVDAIEQAVLQSPEVQAMRRDAERIEWLEEQTKKSYTGISFDYYRHVEDGYVLDHGYRFMRRHFASGFKDSLRKAIDAAMEKQK